MADDAVLSVGIENNASAVMSRIVQDARKFGDMMGATAKDVERGVSRITGSLAKMGGAGGSGSAGGGIKTFNSAATAQLAKYRAEMERLNAASNVRVTASGRYQSQVTGRLVSGADVAAYQAAAQGASALESRIAAAAVAQRALSNSTSEYARRTGFIKQQNQAWDNQGFVLTKAARSAEVLQGVYENMWGGGLRRQIKSVWPPDMLRGPEQFVAAMEKMPNSVRYAMYDIARTTAIAGTAVAAFGVGGTVAAASFERSWADVQRTVFGTAEITPEVTKLRGEILEMSKELPVAFSNLTDIASVGGQMGVNAGGIANYTETIAKLTATTNLTADAASFALGRFKAFFAEADDPSLAVTDATFSNLASSILKVGVNSVATESGIVNVSTQISSMGSYAGFTADQVIGLAGSLSSIGVPPELSRGVITRLFNIIGEAASTGGTKLQAFAQLAGMSAEQFKASWQTADFAGTFTQMIAGLGELSRGGGDAVSTLHELGITSVRDVPVLLRLANAAGESGKAGSLLAQTMEDARIGWKENSELAMQYGIVASTLTERLKVLANNFQALFAAIGGSSIGPLKFLVDTIINITRGLSAMIETPVGQWVGGVITVVTLLTGTLLLATAGAARFTASAQAVTTGLTQMGISAAVAAPLVRGLGIALGALGVVGAIAAVIGLFVGMASAADQASGAAQNTAGALDALRADSDKGTKGFMTIRASAEDSAASMTDAQKASELLAAAMVDLEPKGKSGADGVREVTRASFEFGTASRDFVKNAILMDQSMQELAKGTYDMNTVGEGLEKVVTSSGYSMDKLIELYASGGRDSAEAYLEGLTGVETRSKWSGGVQARGVTDQVALAQNALLDIVGKQVDGLAEQGRIALIAGDSMRELGKGTEYATEVTEEFAVANEDALKKVADGLTKFTDTKSLINFTQSFVEAQLMTGDSAEQAAEKAQKAWSDYYGGTAFKLSDYLSSFEAAAAIQEDHMNNLRALAARGVPDDIIQDLSAMGPDAVSLVEAMVNGTQDELDRYVKLYGETGYNAMVAFAAQQMSAQSIVENVGRSIGKQNLNAFAAELQRGTPLKDALAKWQLDAQGNPLKAEVITEMNARDERRKLQNKLGNGIQIPVTPYLTKTTVAVVGGGNPGRVGMTMYAGGGYTGPGHWLKPAGMVHAGEYVHPKRDVDQRTGLPKESALIRMLMGGHRARPSASFGYANGGLVAGMNMGMFELGPASIQAIARSIDPRVFLDGRDLSASESRANRQAAWEGQG